MKPIKLSEQGEKAAKAADAAERAARADGDYPTAKRWRKLAQMARRQARVDRGNGN